MINGNLKLALTSIRSTRWRSLFTMLGIIIGVVSVLTVVSLGEGVKKEVNDQIEEYGSDLIIVSPGQSIKRDKNGKISNINIFSGFGNVGSLSDDDVEAVSSASSVQTVAPLSIINGLVSYDGNTFPGSSVIATTNTFPELLNHKVEFGEFFRDTDEGRQFAVIGKNVAEQVFQENIPVGKALDFRGERYIVKGVLEEFDVSPFAPGANYNNAIFIPYVTGKSISNGSPQIFQIIAKPSSPNVVDTAQNGISKNLRNAHGGQADFSVLKQDETRAVTNQTLNTITGLVATIAAISLFVGGIGVMNVMIVSVTERTHEIGVRKAIGATDKQILGQFLAESIVLSVVGGMLGVITTGCFVIILRLSTNLTPILTLPMVVLAILVAIFVGTLFGVAPAVKAARKDPIAALRHE